MAMNTTRSSATERTRSRGGADMRRYDGTTIVDHDLIDNEAGR